jgi:hypothetical protein
LYSSSERLSEREAPSLPISFELSMQMSDHLYLDECVIQNKHNGCEIPRNWRVEKEHLSNVTDVSSFWMAQTKFPELILECAKEWRSSEHTTQQATYIRRRRLEQPLRLDQEQDRGPSKSTERT